MIFAKKLAENSAREQLTKEEQAEYKGGSCPEGCIPGCDMNTTVKQVELHDGNCYWDKCD